MFRVTNIAFERKIRMKYQGRKKKEKNAPFGSTVATQKRKKAVFLTAFKSLSWDSNPRPAHYE